MESKRFNFVRFLLGLILFTLGIWMGNFWDYSWILAIVGLFMTVFCMDNDYFCADCGNYVGRSPKRCTRCGCNISTKYYDGSGRTTRHR